MKKICRELFKMKKIPFLCIWIFYITFWAGTNVFGQENNNNLPDQIIQDIPPNGIVIMHPEHMFLQTTLHGLQRPVHSHHHSSK